MQPARGRAAVGSCAGGTRVGWLLAGAGHLQGTGTAQPGTSRAPGQAEAALGWMCPLRGSRGVVALLGQGLLARGLPGGSGLLARQGTLTQQCPRGPGRLWGLGKKL